MRGFLARIERVGFFIFFLGLFLAAIGIASDTRLLWMIGVAVVIMVLLGILVRARRAVSVPRRPAAPDRARRSARPPGTTRPEDV